MRGTVTARIYRDAFTPARPWACDLHHPEGGFWKKYCSGFKTLKGLTEYLEAVGSIEVIRDKSLDRGC